MKLCIETINLTNADDLFAHTEQQLRPALILLERHVKSLTVQLEDVSGPKVGPSRGGVDKRCVMVVVPHTGTPMIFDDVHADVRQVLALTMRHLKRWIDARELQRLARPALGPCVGG